MSAALTALSDDTWRLICRVLPGLHRDTHCYLFAAAAVAATGGRFTAGAAYPYGETNPRGWAASFNPADRGWATWAPDAVDADGGYEGHCWAEIGGRSRWTRRVLDLMTGYCGTPVDSTLPVGYFPSASLTRSVRGYHRANILTVRRAVQQNPAFIEAVRATL